MAGCPEVIICSGHASHEDGGGGGGWGGGGVVGIVKDFIGYLFSL